MKQHLTMILLLTEGCNLGPRIIAYLAGWGRVAVPGPKGGFLWVYVVALCSAALWLPEPSGSSSHR